MKLTKEDMDNILKNYNIGTFKKFGKVAKNDVISLSQIVYTTKNKVFMKVCNARHDDVIQSLKVASSLWKKGFPVYEVFLTKDNKKFFNYKKHPIVFLEFIDIPIIEDWPMISEKQMKDYARQLARFHNLTKKIKLKQTSAGSHKDISGLISKFYKKRKSLPTFAQEALSFMKKQMPKTLCKAGEYKSGYFSEYNPGHVYFNKNKVSYVIDWEIGRNYSYYDLGSSLIACFLGNKISYKKIKTFIKEYNKSRTLSKWEKDHLYEALTFGAFKYNIWNLIDLKTGYLKKPDKIKKSDLDQVYCIMDLSKDKFLKKIK